MESIKDNLNFCNAALFYDYKNVGITCEINQVRKCINKSFYKTIPESRIRVSLSVIDDINLKILDIDIEKIIEKIHDLRENIFHMLSFEKLIRDKQQIIKPILSVDEKNYFKENKLCK